MSTDRHIVKKTSQPRVITGMQSSRSSKSALQYSLKETGGLMSHRSARKSALGLNFGAVGGAGDKSSRLSTHNPPYSKLEKLKQREVLQGPPDDEIVDISSSSDKVMLVVSPIEPTILNTEDDDLLLEYNRLQR